MCTYPGSSENNQIVYGSKAQHMTRSNKLWTTKFLNIYNNIYIYIGVGFAY